MANLANWVAVPCLIGPTAVGTVLIDSAAFYRTPTPQPLGVVSISGGAPAGPVGAQRWPVKL